MNKDEQKAYWIELADYDIDTAQAMYDTQRLVISRFHVPSGS